jgi:hypothetical protein
MADKEVRRGSFAKDGLWFDVCASSAVAPEAMRVYQSGDRSTIALVVSGLNSGDLKASWGAGWDAYPREWRDDFEELAYRAYVSRDARPRPTPRSNRVVRVCNG